MYIVGTDKKCLSEVLLISTHTMFCDKKKKLWDFFFIIEGFTVSSRMAHPTEPPRLAKIYGIPFLSTAIKIIWQVLWRNEKNVPVHSISYNFTCVLSKDSDSLLAA